MWQYQIELPPRGDGRRRPLRNGGYPSQADALAVPGPDDTADLAKVGDLIETAVRANRPVPTVGEWLNTGLAGRKNIKRSTVRGYASHMRIHLVPHLGGIRLDRLRVGHITGMFDDIDDRNEQLRALHASEDPARRRLAYGKRVTGSGIMRSVRAMLRAR